MWRRSCVTSPRKLDNKKRSSIQLLTTLTNVDEAYLDLFIAHDEDPDSGGEYFFELTSNDILLLGQFGLPSV
jgi:hypothetical protein